MRYTAPLFFLLTTVVAAQTDVAFSTSTDRTTVAVGDTLVYRMTVRGSQLQTIPAFSPPNFGKQFQTVGSEESVTYQLTNGALNAVKTRSLRLRALSEGTVEIPPAELRIGKDVLKSQPIRITVSPAPKGSNPVLGQSTPAAENNLVFLKTQASKTTPYVGEQVILTLTLYRRMAFYGNPEYEPLRIAGALTEPVATQEATEESTYNGQRFYTNTLQQVRITPLSAGKLVIPGVKFGFHTSPFDRMQVIQAQPLTLDVRPLPTPPKDTVYSGVVGDFTWTMDPVKQQVSQLSPMTLTFTIKGTGTLTPLSDLTVTDSPDFKHYRSNMEETPGTSTEGDSKSIKKITYIVIPQTSGTHALPTFSWTYFSPKQGRYITLKSQEMQLTVVPATGNVAVPPKTTPPASEDIRYLHPLNTRSPLTHGAVAYGLWILGIGLVLSRVAYGLWHRLKYRNPDVTKHQKAYKIAIKAIQELHAQPDEANLTRVYHILLTFLGSRLGVSVKGLTHPEIKVLLEKADVDPLLVVNTLDVMEKVSFALYAPSRVDAVSKAALIQEAEALLMQLKSL